jgi:hypothetical protein
MRSKFIEPSFAQQRSLHLDADPGHIVDVERSWRALPVHFAHVVGEAVGLVAGRGERRTAPAVERNPDAVLLAGQDAG